MNLTTDKWIPIVWQDGRPGKVSLLDAFQQGEAIRDLAVRPHERIAVMRLLICIAQAALDGPKDRAEWKACRARLPEAAADYLAKWKHAFELFGDGQRFLQIPVRPPAATEDDGGGTVDKLDLVSAAGNNSTLFDNAGGSGRRFTGDVIALNLLTYQNYSPLVGRGYKGRSPCMESNMLHTLGLGSHLHETIWINLLTAEQVGIYMGTDALLGRPVWEAWESVLQKQREAVKSATETYLGRLCPLPRAIWLAADGSGMQMGNGLEYPEFREATTTIILNRKGDACMPLAASPTKGIWRDLSSITVVRSQEENGIRGPLFLQNQEGIGALVIWSGALISDGKAKLIDSIESRYSIPAAMFTESGCRIYQSGVHYAEAWEVRTGKAIASFRRAMKDEIEGEFWKRGIKVKQKASTYFWTSVEQHIPLLLALVRNSTPLYPRPGKANWGATEWGCRLASAARAAYELACPHETPRQLKAYSLGLNALFKPEDKPDSSETTEDTEP